ncbi:MAG: beta-glucuronidase [Spirochaetaceae bacterium]|jgi:beta-glucuronidase|nr:beta-glucuronidase [Spirochaetaceae bacterium]
MKKTAALLYPRSTAARQAVSLDGMWKFRLDTQGSGIVDGWKDGIGPADTIPVPASFQDFFTDKNSREYTGDFWYETEFFVPPERKGKSVYIRFGSVTHRGTVFVNGAEIARHEGGFLPFAADIAKRANYGGSNRLVVKGNNELSETNLPVGRTTSLPDGRKAAKPYFDFFNYSGIQRPVRLLALPKTAITDLSLIPRLNGDKAELEYAVETLVETGEEMEARLSVLDEEGRIVVEAQGAKGVLAIPNPRLWKVRDAYLYRVWARLYRNGELLDEWYEDSGLRTVEIRGTELLLNGESVYLKGFGKHEDADLIGRGYSLAHIKRDFELMKWIGANSFRTSHYPYAEEVYLMADREGFLVIDEAPAVGLFDTTNNALDTVRGKKKVPFFDKETLPELLETHLKAVQDMIARDKNHPSVIAWSLFNEPEDTSETAIPYFKAVFDAALDSDPQKRPRTFAVIMFSRPDTSKGCQFSDFICLNRYYGWYVLGGCDIDIAEQALRSELDGWKAQHLNKPFMFTEYGADTDSGLHKLPSVQWSQEYQIEALEMNHRVFDAYDFIKGEQVWAFADFQTGEGIHRLDGNKKGIFTRQRQPKAAAFYLKNRRESLPENYKSRSNI